MKRVILGGSSIIMVLLNFYLYTSDPLEKDYNLIKIIFGWLVVLFLLSYLLRNNKTSGRLGYILSLVLLALAYFVLPT